MVYFLPMLSVGSVEHGATLGKETTHFPLRCVFFFTHDGLFTIWDASHPFLVLKSPFRFLDGILGDPRVAAMFWDDFFLEPMYLLLHFLKRTIGPERRPFLKETHVLTIYLVKL